VLPPRAALPFILLVSTHAAAAEPTDWAAWNSKTASTCSGVIATPDGNVAVTYEGEIFFAQVGSNSTNYYVPGTPFLSPQVLNAPPTSDIIAFTGGGNTGTHTIRFDPPIRNPVMAIVSLGQPNIVVTYDFDVPFNILSFGPGYWGGPGTLNNIGGRRLTGVEGHGTIRFIGPVSAIHWTIPNPETWHGITVGIPRQAPCPGDFNNDALVDDADFVIFAASYNIADCLDPAMPVNCPADLNGDSSVDDEDFLIFVLGYNEVLCP